MLLGGLRKGVRLRDRLSQHIEEVCCSGLSQVKQKPECSSSAMQCLNV
jgi:hypothetical protein